MCILFLVVVKLFEYSIVSNLFRSCNKKDVPSGSKANNLELEDDRDVKDNGTQIIDTIHRLSQDRHNHFSMPLIIPLIYFSVCLIVLVIPIIYDINRLLYTFIFFGTALPFYFMFVWPNDLPNWVKFANLKVLIMFQKLFLALPDELKS